MAVYHLDCAQLKEAAPSLRAGDRVLLSGTAYTARDAAHKRIAQALEAGEPLPFALEGAVVYYAGPTPARLICRSGVVGRRPPAGWMFILLIYWIMGLPP